MMTKPWRFCMKYSHVRVYVCLPSPLSTAETAVNFTTFILVVVKMQDLYCKKP